MDDGQSGAISTSDGGRNPKLGRLLIIQVYVRFGFQTAAKKPENSTAFLEQELSHCGIFRQTDRSAVRVCALPLCPTTLRGGSASRPATLIMRDHARGKHLLQSATQRGFTRSIKLAGTSDMP